MATVSRHTDQTKSLPSARLAVTGSVQGHCNESILFHNDFSFLKEKAFILQLKVTHFKHVSSSFVALCPVALP